MNKPVIIACLIISIILFSSNTCLAQQNFTEDIQALKKNPKINMPDTVLEDFMKGKPTIRVIVNLRDPLAEDPTFDQDSNNRDRTPAVSRPVRNNLKNLSVRRRLRNDVNAMQNRVINALNMDRMRITNRFKYIFGFSAEITLQRLQDLAKHPDVLSIDKDMLIHANLAQGIPLMNASTISGIYNGSGMAIAICDTGIDYNHSMLGSGGFPNDKVIGGYDTGEDDDDPIDGHGHGTACAGIAAGSPGNTGDYIGGVAYSAKLYALKISNTSTGGSASSSDMIEAWEWCVTHQNDDPFNPIMIISTSFGGGRFTDNCDDASSAMTAAAANAKTVGITLFVSSGNDGYCDATGWPACISDVISVGAVYDAALGVIGWCVSEDSCATKFPTTGCSSGYYAIDNCAPDLVTVYSNTASFLSLFAPSNWAYTTKLGGGYCDTAYGFGGTSAACPYAAGAAACLQNTAKARTGAYLTPDQVESYLTDYGDLITDSKVAISKPRINLENSTDAITSAPLLTTTAVSAISANSASSGGNVTDDGAVDVTARGVCWSLSADPTTNDSYTTDGMGAGSFTSSVTGLSPNTTYHVRAYATNTEGTAYGNEVSFTTQETPPPPDSDNDGVPDSWKQGPDGDDPDYDGNGDGIPDCQQRNVASFHTWDTSGVRHYITLEVPEGQRIEYPYALRTFDTSPPSGVSFPYGFFTFKITGLEQGGTSNMTIYLDGAPPQTYYKYGKTPDNPADHWYEFSYDGETGAELIGNTIVLHFVDGLRGDHDLKVNGEIQDPGGPAAIETLEVLYFPYLISTDEEETRAGIINTENYTVTSTISYYGKDGDLITTANMTLGAKGKTTIPSDSIPSDTATAIISADGTLSGYTRYVNTQGQRCAWPANIQPQDSIPVPHTATDSNWATALCLFNPNDEDVEVTLDYYSGTSGNLTLISKSQDFFWLTESETVSSISATGYITAMEMFDSLTSGGDRAALLLKKRYLNALYVPCISYGAEEFTGVGLINGYHDGTVSVFGHNETGEVEEVALGSLSALTRITADISGILDDDNLWAHLAGETDFIGPFGASSMLFDGLAVYGANNTGKLGAVNLNALKFKEGFIGIISSDPEPFFALVNPDTVDATLSVTGYNSDGAVLASNTIQIMAGNNLTGTVSDLLDGASLDNVTHIRIVSDVNIYGFETIYTDDRMEMLPVLAVD